MVAAPHPILLRPPLILERTEQNFIEAVYRDLRTSDGRERLRVQSQRSIAAGLRLKQPVHRSHTVLLMDVACDGYGYPRLDPRKIASAGIVVRRVLTDAKGQPLAPERLEGWISQEKVLRGWMRFDNPSDLEYDPDPNFRRAPYASAHAEINRRLLGLQERHFRLKESSSPAFVTPPDICEAAGRTLVYGTVPVTSFETAEDEPTPVYTEEEMLVGYSTLFTAGSQRSISTAAMPDFVRQVGGEYGAFGTDPEGAALFAVLNELTIPGTTNRAGDFLKQTYSRIYEKAPADSVSSAWPAISAVTADKLKRAVFAVKQKRLATFQPRSGRFDDANARYRARMFVRVRNHPECPPELHWSDYTPLFQIAPWYEHSGPPVRITLPNIDRNSVKNLKPNVAFELPPGLFNMLANNSPDSFLKGEAQEGGVGLGIAWLCSFSLPIITLCAFIVLNIFLQLFNIVFFWLLWIKICIPIPVPKKS